MWTIYDNEIYPTVFTCGVTPWDPADNSIWIYEISRRRNDADALARALRGGYFTRMYGFNSLNFDWPLLHRFLQLYDTGATAEQIVQALYHLANEIIGSSSIWSHRVKPWEILVEQCDLMLVHHLDNVARRTSLKTLEFNMRSPSVQELPFKPGTYLTDDQIPVLIDYQGNDLRETKRFAHHTKKMIDFRDALGPEYLNANDTKIGKQFFIKALEERQPGICYDQNRRPRQTWRPQGVRLADVIFPWIRFQRPELTAVLEWMRGQTITETKGAFKELHAIVDGFRFDFGTGGIHGSMSNATVTASDGYVIRDIDVTSYYPAIAIVNGLYPAHLGPLFVEVYRMLRDRRVTAKQLKNFVEADALKLANNGVYGDSGNEHGPFLDLAYLLSITCNGQFLIAMLSEAIMAIPTAQLIQVNTDGLTVRVHASHLAMLEAVCSWWQHGTDLQLEFADYAAMWIRDVNNYLGLFSQHDMNKEKRGTVKRKGAYDYDLKVGDQIAWWKDFSGLVIPRAAEAALVHDQDPEQFIEQHADVDPWDFMLRAKVNRGARLELGDGTKLQSIVRYFIAHSGQSLVKIMPPLKGQSTERRIGIHAEGTAMALGERGAYRCSACNAPFPTKELFGAHNKEGHCWRVQIRNEFNGDISGVNLGFYVRETEKLLLT